MHPLCEIEPRALYSIIFGRISKSEHVRRWLLNGRSSGENADPVDEIENDEETGYDKDHNLFHGFSLGLLQRTNSQKFLRVCFCIKIFVRIKSSYAYVFVLRFLDRAIH